MVVTEATAARASPESMDRTRQPTRRPQVVATAAAAATAELAEQPRREVPDMAATVATAALAATVEAATQLLPTRQVRLAAMQEVVVTVVPVALPRRVRPEPVEMAVTAESLGLPGFHFQQVQPAAMAAAAAPADQVEAPVREEPTVTVVTAARRATAPTDLMVGQPLWQLLEITAAMEESAELAVTQVRPERAWAPRELKAWLVQQAVAATAATVEQVSMDRWA